MKNYGDIPKQYSEYKTAKVVILPVPYDNTSTWIKGANKGPEALLEASANMELYDIETNSEVYKHGIYTAKPIVGYENPEDITMAIETAVEKYLTDKKLVVTIGGEHSVSIGAIQAYAKTFKNLTVVQIDAHADLRSEYENSRYNHACVMARVKEICPYLQIGIRSMSIEEKDAIVEDRVFWAEKIIKNPMWIQEVIQLLDQNVYITIDLDGFDPSILPSTGTPEPGGLSWYDVITLIKAISQKSNIVGFDIVELCPNPKEKSSDFIAAKLLYKILSYKYESK